MPPESLLKGLFGFFDNLSSWGEEDPWKTVADGQLVDVKQIIGRGALKQVSFLEVLLVALNFDI